MSALGLGIDAGGTRTRWALAAADGAIVAEGEQGGMSALQMGSEDGRAKVRESLATLAAAAMAASMLVHGKPQAVRAGLTGFGGDDVLLQQWLAARFGLPVESVVLSNDIEIACLASFAPGEGYVVYAGTGSIGAFIDADGVFHRAGGRGVILDDGGGGFWIAREALRHIWRNEDEEPGRWRASPMAQAVFAQIGGDEWALSREFMYGQERGEVGRLALAVAASADADPVAAAILSEAGRELARLARALIGRFGARPVVLGGRAATLHPLIVNTMRAELPDALSLTQTKAPAHHAAARLAANAPVVPVPRQHSAGTQVC